MLSGRLLFAVVLLYLGARTSRDDHEVVFAGSTSGVRTSFPSMTVVQLSAQSNQSLMILVCAGPNLGLPTLVGVASGLSLNLCGPTCFSGLGSSFVFLEKTDSYFRSSAIIMLLISCGTSGHISIDSRGIGSSLYSFGFFLRYSAHILSER